MCRQGIECRDWCALPARQQSLKWRQAACRPPAQPPRPRLGAASRARRTVSMAGAALLCIVNLADLADLYHILTDSSESATGVTSSALTRLHWLLKFHSRSYLKSAFPLWLRQGHLARCRWGQERYEGAVGAISDSQGRAHAQGIPPRDDISVLAHRANLQVGPGALRGGGGGAGCHPEAHAGHAPGRLRAAARPARGGPQGRWWALEYLN